MRAALNILLADDSEDDVASLQRAFDKAGVKSSLYVVPDGAEAVAYLSGEGRYLDRHLFPVPDSVLLDVNMPKMDGFEVLAWIRQQPLLRHLMVHILSNSARDADVQHAYDLQANTYVVKPSNMGDLIEFVCAFHALSRFIRLSQKPLFWDGRSRKESSSFGYALGNF